MLAVAAEPGASSPQPAGSNENSETPAIPKELEHELSPKAGEIGRVHGFPITDSMVSSWIVALGLIIFTWTATRRMKLVPRGAQNLLEWMVEGVYGLLRGMLGEHLTRRTFWYLATVFIFILSTSWFDLIPGVGTVGWGHRTSHGFMIDQPLIRAASADVNLTLAMSLIFFACWIVWCLRDLGGIGFLKELFGPKGDTTGVMKILMIFIFLVAGCLEVVSILFRPVSLTFRLYGNIFAGEKMLETMSNLVPALGWLIPIPFYFLELLMGLVQALVFMVLTAVFTLLMCVPESEAPEAVHG
jgi:F-type H+-transporting ATPase subunit a